MLNDPKMAKNSQKWPKIVIHESPFFGEKNHLWVWAKRAENMLRDPQKMSYGLAHPSENFHGSKNEIFGPFASSTEIKGDREERLPRNIPI